MSATPNPRRQPKSQRRSARQIAAQRRDRQRRMLTWAAIAVGAAVIAVVALIFLNQEDDSSPAPAIAYSEVGTDGRTMGSADAPVKLVVYSDFQCPFCKQFDDEDLPKVVDNFVTSGDVRVEWRPMPIISQMAGHDLESPENESVQAAEAAMCAADQGQFWQYSDALFDAQGAENSGVYSDEMLKQTAVDLGLDTETFNECLDSGEKQDEVLELRQDGTERGVQGTPTFLINDQLVSYTAEGYGRMESQINDALEGNMVEN
jgi:protein-disulfide isomerase